MSNYAYIVALFLVGFLVACSDSTQVKDVPKPAAYVTNAEHALESIELNKTSVVAFQVKPVTSAACKYMYIEFGRKNGEGKWEMSNSIYPGKDPRNNFGQQKLKDQVHFAEVDGSGEFSVMSVGCKPYGKNLKRISGLLATFNVSYGKVNYIGEVTLVPKGSQFYHIEVGERTDFVLEQIQSQLPELEPYFQKSLMEKFVIEISPEKRAKIEALTKKVQGAKQTLDARNLVAVEYNAVLQELRRWDDAHGHKKNNISDKLRLERKNILRDMLYTKEKIDTYDRFAHEGIDVSIIQTYMKLYDNVESHRKIYSRKYTAYSPNNFGEPMDPEKSQLLRSLSNARKTLKDFEKKHNLK